MIETIKLVFCHLIGDYVLQIDFIAKSKGSNLYHMFVHCALYCVPFAYLYEIDWRLCPLFIFHIVTDLAKAKYNTISYVEDQFLHYITLAAIYLI